MQKYLNRIDLHIIETLKKIFFFGKWVFYRLNQPRMPKKTAKFVRRASCEIIQENDGTEERRIILRREMMEYPKKCGMPYCMKEKAHKIELQ